MTYLLRIVSSAAAGTGIPHFSLWLFPGSLQILGITQPPVTDHLVDGHSLARVLPEHPLNQIYNARRTLFPPQRSEGYLRVQNGLVCFVHAVAAEGHFPGDYIIENDSEGPDVDFLVVKTFLVYLLGSHVSHCAAEAFELLAWLVDDGLAEISQFQVVDDAILVY